ncbi:hypothetical protein XCR_3981 [Xanthomonas campestris pv. raphani 756C]|nr:hypothetical protein XCR_3981 [Xanthomonas campestris pv. raphani 756C]
MRGGDGQRHGAGQGERTAQGHNSGRQPHRQLLVIGECGPDCRTNA